MYVNTWTLYIGGGCINYLNQQIYFTPQHHTMAGWQNRYISHHNIIRGLDGKTDIFHTTTSYEGWMAKQIYFTSQHHTRAGWQNRYISHHNIIRGLDGKTKSSSEPQSSEQLPNFEIFCIFL